MHCHTCKTFCIKKGFQKNRTQKYYCKCCKRYQQLIYNRKAFHPETDQYIKKLVKAGSGIADIKNVLEIASNTASQRIQQIAAKIQVPPILIGKEYEMDEMRTYIGNKTNLYWIAYAIEKRTSRPVSFFIGKRTNRTLKAVIKTLLLSDAKKIYTDGCKNYRYLIPCHIHRIGKYGTVNIERENLNLRTHLKRLQRKTICFSRSLVMLTACLKIYFWG